MNIFQEIRSIQESTLGNTKDAAIHSKWASYHKRAAKGATGLDKENHEAAAKAHTEAKKSIGTEDAEDKKYAANRASMKCFQDSK